MKYFIPFIFSAFFFFVAFSGCHNHPREIMIFNKPPLVIDIRPFSDIPLIEQQSLYNSIKKIYPHTELKPAIAVPPSAYFPARNRYKADSLISYLKNQTPEGHVSIGITTKDISTTKGKFADWGVMGLGYRPGVSCVASSFRLTNGKKANQLYKVAIHELGHTQGLPHCPVKTCFMRDAEGKNVLEEENDFCKSCKAFLLEKGFPF